MQTLEDRLRLKAPLAPHVTGILSLVVAAQAVMARVGAACESHGITRPQYNALRILRGAGQTGLPRHEIAARLVENAPDVTRIIDRLCKAGYVRRARSDSDRRESLAWITPTGLRLLVRIDPVVAREENRVGALLSTRQWQQLARLTRPLFNRRTLDS